MVPDSAPATRVDIAIIGAGFSGLGTAIRLRQQGLDDFLVLERHEDVGGTWWANTYPGCACDVPSHLYSFSFAPNPEWSQTYSPQPEIRAYRPQEGFLIVFPSYFYHHTVPYEADEQRVSIAFDVLRTD